MIKCIGYLKSLKQLLSILLISCFIFGLGSFASATFQTVGIVKQNSSINQNFQLGFLKKGGIITDYLGQGKGIIALDNDKLFWWSANGKPYFYSPDWQGYFIYYTSCPEIVYSGDSFVFNTQFCTRSVIPDTNYESIFSSFLSTIKDDDFVFYEYRNEAGGVNYSYHYYSTDFCFSSSELHSTMCFDYNSCYYGGPYGGYNRCTISDGGGFTGSLNYQNLTFASLPLSEIGRSPGLGGGSSEGSSNTDITIGITGDYSYSTCTNGEILSMLGNMGYNKYLCYGGLDNFDLWNSSGSYSPIPGTGKRLSQILSYSSAWDSPQEWFDFWNGLYQDKDNPLYYTMWESYPAVYRTWFDMYYKYNGPGKKFDDIREYCVMSVDLSLNSDTVYNGTQFMSICSAIIDIKQNPDSTYNQSGVFVGVNWKGVGILSGDSKTATQFIQDFFNTIKSQINTDYDGPGFLPGYIILFLLALIFFRFISH